MRGQLTLALAVVSATLACKSSTTRVEYNAQLAGSSEVPAVQSNGSGTFTGTIDANNVLNYTLTFTGLTSNATLAHIHGPASTTQSAGILVNLNAPSEGRTITLGGTSGSGSGTINLTTLTTPVSGDSLLKLLDNGQAYVNIHTANYGGGEIRGQLTRRVVKTSSGGY